MSQDRSTQMEEFAQDCPLAQCLSHQVCLCCWRALCREVRPCVLFIYLFIFSFIFSPIYLRSTNPAPVYLNWCSSISTTFLKTQKLSADLLKSAAPLSECSQKLNAIRTELWAFV